MRKILLLLFLNASILSSYADSVSPQAAQQTASSFFAARGKTLTTATISTYSVNGTAGQEYAPYYIFNAEGDGFVIISGNSLTEEILGYSDTGELDEETLDDNIRSWLQAYADEINWVADNESAVLAARATAVQTYATPVRHALAPLLTCNWGQGDPYNYLCPTYTSSSGESGVSAVGCIATALAQVMYYHKYPAATVGEIPAYTSYSLPAVPAGTTLDWDNMLDSYEGDYTDAQRQAVAELSLYIGQSVRMNYGASSGSTYSRAKTMFEDYFGYAEGVLVARNTDYSIQEWHDLIYNEIEAGYPIAFSGYPASGSGHAFVLDGYDGDGFFHVNWGWSGGSNGYFRLTALDSGDTTHSDIFSSTVGYSRNQDAVLYVRSQETGSATPDTRPVRIYDVRIPTPTYNLQYIIKNLTGTTATFENTVLMLDETGALVPATDKIISTTISTGSTSTSSFNMSDCFAEPGEYLLTPASRLEGTDEWTILWTLDGDDYVLAEVDDDLTVELTLHETRAPMVVTNWEYTGYLVIGQDQRLQATLVNEGDKEYSGSIYLYAQRPDATGKGSLLCTAYVGVESGGESKVDFSFNLDTVGEWYLHIEDSYDVLGTDTIQIVSKQNATMANLSVPSITISNDCYGSRLTGTATIKNNADDDFNGQIRIYLWTSSGGGASSPGSTTYNVSGLASGRTTSLAFDFGGLNIGQGYSISVRDKAIEEDIADGGGIDWSMPYVLKAGILQWSNDGSISGSAAKDALAPTTSVAGIFCEDVSPAAITPSRNTNTIYAFTASTAIPDGVEGYNVVYGSQAEQITFANNGYAAYLPLTFTAHEAVYRHTFATTSDGVTGWEALVLPFKPDGVRCEGADIAWKHGADDEDGVFYLREFAYEDDSQTVIFDDVEDISSLWANAPYVIAATPAMAGKTVEFYAAEARLSETGTVPYIACTDDYRFYGTTLRVRDSGLYVLNNEGYAYEYKSGTASVSPFENYFITTLPEDQRPEMIYISTEAATGIRAVESAATQKDGVYYDLQGRRITAPTKGVYILNGKKYVK